MIGFAFFRNKKQKVSAYAPIAQTKQERLSIYNNDTSRTAHRALYPRRF
jgi:hypothetical protein